MSPTAPPLPENIYALFDAIAARGFCKGTGEGEQLCIMQAINLAERGLSDADGIRDITDSATCVAPAATSFAIRLNYATGWYGYAGWSSEAARAKGLLKFGHALIGSIGIDEQAWLKSVRRRYIQQILPIAFRKLAELKAYEADKIDLLAAASRCEKEGTIESAAAARDVARAARDRARKVAAAEVAVAAVAAAAAAAAVVVAAAGHKPYSTEWWAAYDAAHKKFWAASSTKRDEYLTLGADIAAEELEIAKAARDASVR